MMPGGNPAAWPHVKEIFQAISAKADGEPCCDWVGDEGAGHYVKMVHNGIEYGDMQLICETYSLLREGVKLEPAELQNLFVKGDLNSYLIEIAAKIFGTKDEDGTLLLDKVLDVAGQKGTGKWTVINSLDLGSPLTLISEAVFARCLSALKEQRARAYKAFSKPQREKVADKDKFITSLKQGLYAAKIISYAQGFMLMKQAASDYGWELNYGSVALMWRGGCIIRSQFLGRIKQAFDKNPELENLLLDEFFLSEITSREEGLRNSAANAIALAIAAPCLTSAISFYDAYRTDKSSANLIQAMRDFFGAHTYERVDQPRGQFFHTDWAGTGGKVSSGTYNV